MKPMEPPDSLHLQAAQGWIELGDAAEAEVELRKISPQLHAHPAVLQAQWHIQARAKKWDTCAEIATAITTLDPDLDLGWIYLGNSLYWAGRTQEAYQRVKAALDRFPNDPVLRYNLGCYACQLGDLEGAMTWLDKAFALDIGQKLKLAALQDPDLEPLRRHLGNLGN